MKKLTSFVLIFVLLVGSLFCNTAQASSQDNKKAGTSVLNLFSKQTDKKATSVASDYLDSIKKQFKSDSSVLGISKEELSGSMLGDSFTIQVCDELGRDISSPESVSFPVIYDDRIIGILELFYDANSAKYGYTFGKAYADELNSLKDNKSINAESELFVRYSADKLIVTDGTNEALIREFKIEHTDPVDSDCYQNEEVYPVRSMSSYSNPLPVPHVAQTGVCGIAAWAAVLNFRFGTSYTNASLATAMSSGYCHGTSGNPNMTDYKNFANDMFYAGCTVGYNPPSFSTVKSCIDSGKPIMGSWYSGSGSSKVYHAIIITGYVANIFNYTYTVKNPWYNYTQTIYVPDSNNVVYVNGGVYWYLQQTVY